MSLISLHVSHFRNHSNRRFSFHPRSTTIIGKNGAGKTNILEAVYVLATGGSWRAEAVDEMVAFGSDVAHIEGKLSFAGPVTSLHPGAMSSLADPLGQLPGSPRVPPAQQMSLSVVLTRGVVQGKRVAKATYKVDGVPRQRGVFINRFSAILFEPESLEIIIGNPTHRRKFLDETLSQTRADYAQSLLMYGKALRVRNSLLDAIRENRSHVEMLEFWERSMVKHGETIQNMRQQVIEWMQGMPGHEQFSIEYRPNIINIDRVESHREREVAAGFTLIGPQRDDLLIVVKTKRPAVHAEAGQAGERLLSAFGSRGEQRMAVLKLKLLEAQWIEQETGNIPLVLLDDVFSELDEEHERTVEALIGGRQAIITATEMQGKKSEEIIEL